MAFFGAIWHLPFVAYVSFGVVVSELVATRAGTILFLSPVYNVVLAVTLLGEVLAQYRFFGLALILLSLWLDNR